MCGRPDLGLSAILSATFYPNGRQNGFIFRWFWRTSSPNGVFLLSDFSFGRFLLFGKFAKVDFAGNHIRGFHLAVHVNVGVNIGRGGKAGGQRKRHGQHDAGRKSAIYPGITLTTGKVFHQIGWEVLTDLPFRYTIQDIAFTRR